MIFRKAQNRIRNPAKLRRLVELINGETWTGLELDFDMMQPGALMDTSGLATHHIESLRTVYLGQ